MSLCLNRASDETSDVYTENDRYSVRNIILTLGAEIIVITEPVWNNSSNQKCSMERKIHVLANIL